MEDYTSLYVKLDTVLLADVFQQFRRLAFQQYWCAAGTDYRSQYVLDGGIGH